VIRGHVLDGLRVAKAQADVGGHERGQRRDVFGVERREDCERFDGLRRFIGPAAPVSVMSFYRAGLLSAVSERAGRFLFRT
jgi:hypothetical protein